MGEIVAMCEAVDVATQVLLIQPRICLHMLHELLLLFVHVVLQIFKFEEHTVSKLQTFPKRCVSK